MDEKQSDAVKSAIEEWLEANRDTIECGGVGDVDELVVKVGEAASCNECSEGGAKP